MESAYMLLGADGKVRHPAAAPARARRPLEPCHGSGLRRASARLRCDRGAPRFGPQKNGEKRLRRLLVRTAEWKNEAQRAAVVRQCAPPYRGAAPARGYARGRKAARATWHAPHQAGEVCGGARTRQRVQCALPTPQRRRRRFLTAHDAAPSAAAGANSDTWTRARRLLLAPCRGWRCVAQFCSRAGRRTPSHPAFSQRWRFETWRSRRLWRACSEAKPTALSCARRMCCTWLARGATKATCGAFRMPTRSIVVPCFPRGACLTPAARSSR